MTPQGWVKVDAAGTCIRKSFVFNAEADITGWSEFSNLFEMYKIDSARCQWYPDVNTQTTNRQSPQIMMITIPIPTGFIPTTIEGLMHHQSIKKQIVFQQDQPLDQYMKLKQASAIYGSDATTNPPNLDYTKVKPKFIPVEEPTALHYGFCVFLLSVNNTNIWDGLGEAAIAIQMWQTIYFTCKGVA